MALSFAEALAKDSPTVSDVHIDSSGARKKPKTFAEALPAKAAQPRNLKPIDDQNSHSPFPHDPAALANLRPDQVPRFFGALTDPDRLDTKTVRLNGLTAMQDRVSNAKVDACRDRPPGGKPATVVRMGGRNYIADGHHRLTADHLNGEHSADVKYLDLSPVDRALKADIDWTLTVPILKTQDDQRLVFGWASVISENGQPVVDSQGDIITEADLEKAFYGFAKDARMAGEMHSRMDAGHMVECMVFTKEKQAALGIDLGKVGAWVGFRLDPEAYAKVKSGEMRAFSIGGSGRREGL